MTLLKRQCRVAILMIEKRPFHVAMANHLYDRINPSSTEEAYRVLFFRTEENRKSIYDTAVSILANNKCDVLISIGDNCSVITKEVLDQIGGHPTVFVGVRDPLALGLVDSLERPGFCLSGVVRESPPLLAVAENFSLLYPAVQNVLLPYFAGDSFLVRQVAATKEYLESRGMKVFDEPIEENSDKLLNLVESYQSRIQGLIFLEGCYSNVLQDEMAFFCWKYCIAFCAGGNAGIDAGASCSYVGYLGHAASEAFRLVVQHWEEQVPLGLLPVISLASINRFAINVDIMRSINIPTEVINRFKDQPEVEVTRKWITPYVEELYLDVF